MASTVFVVVAHPDDQIIGPGGTVAKLAAQGAKVKTIIFSYGESSHPHLKRSVIARTRVQESRLADKVVRGSGLIFFGLREGRFEKDLKQKRLDGRLAKLLKNERPERIFTHSRSDYHPDHRAVRRLVLDAVDTSGCSCEVYSFNVWQFRTSKRDTRLVVDTTESFAAKVEALRRFKSQFRLFSHTSLVMNLLLAYTYIKDHVNGFRFDTRCAEVFVKER